MNNAIQWCVDVMLAAVIGAGLIVTAAALKLFIDEEREKP